MDDLVQWLRAQLDEDERILREANTSPEMVTGIPRSYAAAPVALHIAEFADPARVLREIDAKRRIIDQHERYSAERRRMMGGWDPQSDDSPILAALAAVYSDRPGFREEWAP